MDQFETWELEAYAEGVNMPQVQQFVQQHPELWATWQMQHQKQEQVYSKLARFDCPSPAQLQKFYWKELTTVEGKQLESHLQQCTSCREELQSLVHFVEGENADVATATISAPSLPGKVRSLLPKLNLGEQIQEFAERMRTIVADFVPPLLPELSPIALRGDDPIPTLHSTHPTALLFTAEENDVSLVAMKEVDGSLFVSGQLLTDIELEEGKVVLTPANPDLPELQASLDASGTFLVNHLRPGYYFMKISFADQSIVIPNILLE